MRERGSSHRPDKTRIVQKGGFARCRGKRNRRNQKGEGEAKKSRHTPCNWSKKTENNIWAGVTRKKNKGERDKEW